MTMKELANKIFDALKDAHDNFPGPTFFKIGDDDDYRKDHISLSLDTDKSLKRLALLKADSLDYMLDMIEDVVVSDVDGERYIWIKTKDM